MKKRYVLALTATLCLGLLAGCGGKDAPVIEDAATEMSHFTIEPSTATKEWKADDGTLVAKYDYETPLMVADEGASEKCVAMTEIFNAKISEYVETTAKSFEETAAYAKDQYQYELDSGAIEADGWETYYSDEVNYEYTTVGQLVSVRKDYATYTGGAHGFAFSSAWNYDYVTSKFIDDIAKLGNDHTEFHDVVRDEILSQIEKGDMAKQFGYWDDYKEQINGWNTDYFSWFTEEGLRVSFPAYSIGSYAAGAQEFVISYDVLKPYLSEYGATLLGL